MTELGQARGHLLSLQLDQAVEGGKAGAPASVNKEGYMNSLNSMKVNSTTEINDLKKARALLKSVISSNPKSASGWIAAARVEELDGKVEAARSIMEKACNQFYDNEDIWLEAARLSDAESTKSVLAKAIQQMPRSKKLWLQAANREADKRSEILKKALEHIPNDVELWKEAVAHEDNEGAKALLHKAVKCIPESTELWLALARLETYDKAKDVLNTAIQTIPMDHTIWVNAAMLEEAQDNKKKASDLIRRAFKKLAEAKVKRAQWLDEAMNAEKAGSLVCCEAIVRNVIRYGLEMGEMEEAQRDKEMRRIWMEEAAMCKS